jgi:hypothetical protein
MHVSKPETKKQGIQSACKTKVGQSAEKLRWKDWQQVKRECMLVSRKLRRMEGIQAAGKTNEGW